MKLEVSVSLGKGEPHKTVLVLDDSEFDGLNHEEITEYITQKAWAHAIETSINVDWGII